MKKQIGIVGILSIVCVLALFVGVLVGCDATGAGSISGLFGAQVSQLPDDSFMEALIAFLPQGADFPIMGDIATVNGEDVPFFPLFFVHVRSDLTAVNPADPVTVHFEYKDLDIEKTLALPSKPVITSGSGPYDSTVNNTIAWNAIVPTPDNVKITIPANYTQAGQITDEDYEETIAGGSVSHLIPANTLVAGASNFPVTVEAVNMTTSLGSSASAGSFYSVGNQEELLISTN